MRRERIRVLEHLWMLEIHPRSVREYRELGPPDVSSDGWNNRWKHLELDRGQKSRLTSNFVNNCHARQLALKPCRLHAPHHGVAASHPTSPSPEEDQGEFQRLPTEVRNDVDTLLIEFEQVYGAPRVNPAIAKIAARLDFRRGFRYSTLRSKFYTYINGGRKGVGSRGQIRSFGPGDWRILVDYARCTLLQRFEDDRARNFFAERIHRISQRPFSIQPTQIRTRHSSALSPLARG